MKIVLFEILFLYFPVQNKKKESSVVQYLYFILKNFFKSKVTVKHSASGEEFNRQHQYGFVSESINVDFLKLNLREKKTT